VLAFRPGVAAGTAIIFLGLGVAAQSATAAFPGSNGRIAYQGYQSLGTVNAQGGDRQPLVPDGTSGHVYPGPQWSPDGTKVAFASNREGNFEVYVVNANGTGLANLTKNPADDSAPAWSPDGRRIAFETNRDGQDEIYVMNADGSSPGNLSAFPRDEFNPAWSPNGQTIVFERDRDGTNHDLWAISPSGGPSSVQQLTTASNDTNPDWSPDGTRIVYQRGDELWTMSAGGGGQASLHVIGARPAWAPDGTRIVFDSPAEGQLYTVSPDGSGGATQLTFGGSIALFTQAPSWQSIPITAPPTGSAPPPTPTPAGATPSGGRRSSRRPGNVRFNLDHRWSYHGSLTRVEALRLTRLSRKSKVTISCRGSSCPFHRRTVSKKKRVDLKPYFRHKLLRKNTRITLTITRPQMKGAVLTFVTRVQALPRVRQQCLKAGRSRPTRSC
jgi:dipeptidyl aminopeptidase/acylaminoacyl peptidase